jgi:predicted permease
MRLWHRFQAVLPRILRREQEERDLEDEIRFDLSEETRLRIERGESPESAQAAVRREFGSVAATKEETREVWGWAFLDRILQDLRFALRTLRKSPGFTFAAVLTLALGIGLCSFLFSTLNGLVLQPLPGAREPEQLVALQDPVSYSHFETYRESAIASDVAAFLGPVPFGVADGSAEGARPERIFGHLVSPEYFSTLGVEPTVGRLFDPATERRGAAPVVVVSERFWRTRLNADPQAAGRTLRINGQPATIVGVAQNDFLGVFPINPADIFVPATADAAVAPELAGGVLDNPSLRPFRVVFRLAPRIAITAAETALEAQARRIEEQIGKGDPNGEQRRRLARLIPAGGLGPFPRELPTLSIAFFGLLMALILSFTCANLAGLMLARSNARGREIAIRLSLGAGRLRLVRQLLTESTILAMLGGAAGLVASYGLLDLLIRSVAGSNPFPSPLQLTPDWRVTTLTFLVSAVAGAGFGLLPALASTRPDLVSALKKEPAAQSGRYRRFGLRNLFMVYQMASAMALVVMMGFMVGGIQQGANRDPGYDTTGLYLFSLDPARDGYAPDDAAALFANLPQRLERRGGATGVTLADPALFRLFSLTDTTISIPAAGEGSKDAVHRVSLSTIGPNLFATLRAPVLQGSEFDQTNLTSDPAPDTVLPAVINHAAAAELFGDANPLGRLVRQDQRVFQVAGVVRYGQPAPFQTEPAPAVFLPLTMKNLRQVPPQGITVAVRTGPGLGLEAIRQELEAIDSRLTMFNAQTMQEHLAQMNRGVQYTTAIYSVVGLFALILASVGLAGITTQAAIRRRKEIGIRMALGAQRRQVLQLVMREGALMVLAGSAIGFVAALGIARLLVSMNLQAAQNFASGATDPVSILGAPVVLVSLAAIACYVPARKAATVDPLVSLREE